MYLETAKKVLCDHKSWVLFENGTYVSGLDEEDAVQLLRENGRLRPGTPSGDFNVVELKDDMGWVVGGSHKDINTFVACNEMAAGSRGVKIGLHGRTKRDRDARELQVIYVQKPSPILLDEVWMVVLPDNKGVIYAIGTSAKEVWGKIIAEELMGTGATQQDLVARGYKAKKVQVSL